MNETRSVPIRAAEADLNSLRVEIEAIATEERETYDALSEPLQGGYRGSAIALAADLLEEAAGDLGTVIDALVAARR